jgi:hypothetical protein
MTVLAQAIVDAYDRGLIDDDSCADALAGLTVSGVDQVLGYLGISDPDALRAKRDDKIQAVLRALRSRRHGSDLPDVTNAAALAGSGTPAGSTKATGRGASAPAASATTQPHRREAGVTQARDPFPVLLGQERKPAAGDLLSNVIRARSKAISFDRYRDAIDEAIGCRDPKHDQEQDQSRGRKPGQCREFIGTDTFELIKKKTFDFLRCHCDLPYLVDKQLLEVDGSVPTPPELDKLERDIYVDPASDKNWLRYFDRIAQALVGPDVSGSFFRKDQCAGLIKSVLRGDCAIELIWSYWHEEAMLVQTMQAISFRFQNRRNGDRDPLSSLEIDPLRPLSNIIWGYIQDERRQLSVPRRAHEYDHQYGLQLKGRAVGNFNPIDSRTRFLEAFHHLLYLCTVFYKEENDATYTADSFPILTALQELHVILAEGAHNQFGDLPTQARAEMLIMQWILARPETREFLPGRASVPYPEDWMPRVEAMRTLQGWKGASINHFAALAEIGERLLLSVRLRDWMGIDMDKQQDAGGNWAASWRGDIQQYVHSYRAVTGVDLAAEANTSEQLELRNMMPSELLARRSR